MCYKALAEELLDIRVKSLRTRYSKSQSKLDHGTSFALNYLHAHGEGLHPKEISDSMGVTTARIAALLNHMEEQGFIERTSDHKDSRRVLVTLTDLGRKRSREIRMESLTNTTKMLEALGPDDAREYVRISKKILNLSEIK